MVNNTFVFHYINKIPQKGIIGTKPIPIQSASAWEEDLIYTRIHLNLKSSIPGFMYASIKHRWAIRTFRSTSEQITWHGEIIDYMIVERQFNAFYDLRKKIFISQADRKIVKNAIGIINSSFKDDFNFSEINIDLNKMYLEISNNTVKNSKITGGWIRRSDKNPIRIEAAFGNEVTNDKEFVRLANKGDFTNLRVVIPFNNKNIISSISSGGSVFFMGKYSLKKCLSFIEFLIKNFKKK